MIDEMDITEWLGVHIHSDLTAEQAELVGQLLKEAEQVRTLLAETETTRATLLETRKSAIKALAGNGVATLMPMAAIYQEADARSSVTLHKLNRQALKVKRGLVNRDELGRLQKDRAIT